MIQRDTEEQPARKLENTEFVSLYVTVTSLTPIIGFVDTFDSLPPEIRIKTMSGQARKPAVLNRDQVREVDQLAINEYGMPGIVLMENAGRNSAQLLMDLGISGRVVICCGKGNNGGDGYVIARHLENAGFDVRVLLCSAPESLSGDAASNLKILQRAGTPIIIPPVDWHVELAQADWIVDALLGTGTQGVLREPFVSVIEAINNSGRRVFAVDLPSGLDCNTGQPLGCCVRAEQTATFVARKPGFDVPGADQWTGKVSVIDIGVPVALLRRWVPQEDAK